MKKSIFRTRDLYLAIFLWSRGIKYLGPEPLTSDIYNFTFENPEKCVEVEKDFTIFKQKLLKSFDNER